MAKTVAKKAAKQPEMLILALGAEVLSGSFQYNAANDTLHITHLAGNKKHHSDLINMQGQGFVVEFKAI